MVSVPILNLANTNQVTYVLNLLCRDKPTVSASTLSELAILFADRYEALLHEKCFRASNLLQLDLANGAIEGNLASLCRTLATSVEKCIDVDSAGVYLRDARGNLQLQGFSVLGLRSIMHTEQESRRLATHAMSSNREQILLNVHSGAGPVMLGTISHPKSLVVVPIRDLEAKPTGAIVCVRDCNKSVAKPQMFTYDDITVIEAMGQAFAPYYEVLFSEKQRLEALSRLGHELKGPITGFRAALEAARKELTVKGFNFQHDYLKDLDGYSNLISELSDGFEAGTDEHLETTLRFERVNLVTDLLAPSMRAIEKTLRSRGYAEGKIRRRGIGAAPRMWLDRTRMLQVIFNLLENAVKYSKPDPAQFNVDVSFAFLKGGYEISFRDRGIGIPPGFERRIFLLGAPHKCAGETGNRKGYGIVHCPPPHQSAWRRTRISPP